MHLKSQFDDDVIHWQVADESAGCKLLLLLHLELRHQAAVVEEPIASPFDDVVVSTLGC